MPFSISNWTRVPILRAHIPASMIDNRQESKSIQPPSCPHYSTALCYSRRQATEILNSHEQGAMQERCQMERMCQWWSHLPEHTHTCLHSPFHGKCMCEAAEESRRSFHINGQGCSWSGFLKCGLKFNVTYPLLIGETYVNADYGWKSLTLFYESWAQASQPKTLEYTHPPLISTLSQMNSFLWRDCIPIW